MKSFFVSFSCSFEPPLLNWLLKSTEVAKKFAASKWGQKRAKQVSRLGRRGPAFVSFQRRLVATAASEATVPPPWPCAITRIRGMSPNHPLWGRLLSKLTVFPPPCSSGGQEGLDRPRALQAHQGSRCCAPPRRPVLPTTCLAPLLPRDGWSWVRCCIDPSRNPSPSAAGQGRQRQAREEVSASQCLQGRWDVLGEESYFLEFRCIQWRFNAQSRARRLSSPLPLVLRIARSIVAR